MSYYHPSQPPRRRGSAWHSAQARSIERLSLVLSVLATPVWLFWLGYYRLVGRPKPCNDPDASLLALRRCTSPWFRPKPSESCNDFVRRKIREDYVFRMASPLPPIPNEPIDVLEWTWDQMRKGPFYHKILPPVPIANDELDRLEETVVLRDSADEKPVPTADSPAAYTIPYPGKIPNIAFIWNCEKGYYDVYEEGKPPRILPDPWPDSPKTIGELLAKYPPISAEEWLARHASGVPDAARNEVRQDHDRSGADLPQEPR